MTHPPNPHHLTFLRLLSTYTTTCLQHARDNPSSPIDPRIRNTPASIARTNLLDFIHPFLAPGQEGGKSAPVPKTKPIICTRCSKPIISGTMIGDGDGSGQRFAHPRCYDPAKYASPVWDDVPSTPTSHPDILRADIADLLSLISEISSRLPIRYIPLHEQALIARCCTHIQEP